MIFKPFNFKGGEKKFINVNNNMYIIDFLFLFILLKDLQALEPSKVDAEGDLPILKCSFLP
jgi:hypothetical protein